MRAERDLTEAREPTRRRADDARRIPSPGQTWAITVGTAEIICTGQVVHHRARVGTAKARLTSVGDDKPLADGTSTCLVMRSCDLLRGH